MTKTRKVLNKNKYKKLGVILTWVGYSLTLLAITYAIAITVILADDYVPITDPESLPYTLGVLLPLTGVAIASLIVGAILSKKPAHLKDKPVYFMNTTTKEESDLRLSKLFTSTGIISTLLMPIIVVGYFMYGNYKCENSSAWLCEMGVFFSATPSLTVPLTILGIIAIIVVIVGSILRMK